MNITTTGNPTNGYKTYISIVAGESVAMAITLAINGTPINLAGYSLKMQINLPDPLLLNTSNGGITITSSSTGAVQVNMASPLTAAFPTGSYAFDFWMTSGSGVETPLLNGAVSVAANVAPVP